jgi:hypothetical protein
MTNDDETFFVLTFGGLSFGLGLIFIFGQLYLACFRMREILSSLSNSRGVLVRQSFARGGLLDAYFVLINVGAYLLLPSKAIKGGALDETDYLRFPRGLLRLIRLFYGAALGALLAALILYFGGRYMGWII